MLADPKARALVTNFANQWLYLRELKSANPDVIVFPDFDDNLRQAFQRETELLFESVVREDRTVLDLLNADYTFVNERLARHYGIPNVYGPDFRRVPVPSDARRGLLGQGSLLLVTSNAEPHVAGDPRQVDSREPARQPAAAAAAERAAARGEADGATRQVGARAHRAAPHEPAVRRLPQDHGPDRPVARELRRHRPLAQRRRGREDRRVRAARGRHADRRRRGAAQGAAGPLGRVRGDDDREAADVRRRPRDEVLRHAGGARRSCATRRRAATGSRT